MKIKKQIILMLLVFTIIIPLKGQDIFKAINDGDLEKVKSMLEKDKELLEAKDSGGWDLLHLSAFRGHEKIVKYLLSLGMNVNSENQRGFTPLLLAAFQGHQDVVELLLDHGADINKKDQRGAIPLKYIVDQGNTKMADFLLSKGASVRMKDNIGSTLLIQAVVSGNQDICRLLIKKGADVNAVNMRGNTPLSIAEREGHKEISALLKSHGAKKGKDLPVLEGKYLGQKSPGSTPVPFALNFVSTERSQLNAFFTPDGSEFYFCTRGRGQSNIMQTRRVKNRWTNPERISFSTRFSEIDLSLSPDGKKMFFCSTRPLEKGGKSIGQHDFWVSERQGDDWGEPIHLGELVNSEREDFYPTVTNQGILYFSSQREGQGTNNIYRSQMQNGIYGKAVKLGPEINSKYRDFDPFIAADESFLIFASERPGGMGGSDLHISFRKKDGSWTPAVNMGKEINSKDSDYTPVVSPDGKYMFFTSGRAGVDDIYWVDSEIIRRIKSRHFMSEYTIGEIPFKKLGHQIFVEAKINDSESDYNFMIDTGGLTFINKTIVQELDLKQRGPMAKITTLNLSGYQIENIFCFTTFDFSLLRRLGTPIHGIIGSNLLERFKVTFDFQAGSLTFSTDTTILNPSDNGLIFTFRNHPVNNAPIIKFKVNQKIIEGMIDTGQPYPVVLPLKDFEQYEKSDISGSIQSKGIIVKWPQTNPSYNHLTRLKSCEFASLKITNVICLFGELPPMLSMPLIGTDFLSQFKMIINYPKDEMMLVPNPDCHFKNNQFSIGLNLNLSENNEIFVEGVWENSPADKLNIQVGDHVIAFNSKKVTPENLIELIEIMKDDYVKSIRLEIKNQNGKRKLNLKKAMLFSDLRKE
jgi:hypothetical protein